MSSPVEITCPTCHAPVAPGTSFCTRCGAVLQVREIAAEVGGGQQWGGRPARRTRGQAAGAGVAGPPPPVATAATGLQVATAGDGWRAVSAMPATVAATDPLGPAFDGVAPAGAGRRVGAYAIDTAVAALVAAAVWGLTGSAVYAGLAAAEVAAGLVVWEARSGRTIGNALLGLRSAQDDVPFAPGLARSVARAAVLGAGHLVVLGQWLVVASSAFDASGRRQGWHDKLAGTLVVDIRALRREEAPVAFQAPVVTGAIPDPAATVAPWAPAAAVGPRSVPQPVAAGAVPPPPATQAPTTQPQTAQPQSAQPQSAQPQSAQPRTTPPPPPVPAVPVPPPPRTTPPPPPVPAAPETESLAGVLPTTATPTTATPTSATPTTATSTTATPPPPPGRQPSAPPSPPAPPSAGSTGSSAAPSPSSAPSAPTSSATPPPPPVPAAPAAASSYVVTLDDGRAMSVSGPGYVGRRPQAPAGERCDHVIEIEDPGRSLSRTHAAFGIDADGFWVADNGSANGTWVVGPDGSTVQGGQGERLHVPAGGTVRLGDRTFTVHPYV